MGGGGRAVARTGQPTPATAGRDLRYDGPIFLIVEEHVGTIHSFGNPGIYEISSLVSTKNLVYPKKTLNFMR